MRLWIIVTACAALALGGTVAPPPALPSSFEAVTGDMAVVFDHAAPDPGIRMFEIRKAGPSFFTGQLTSDWYGTMPMSNIVSNGRTLSFGIRNINTPGTPTRRWTATLGRNGLSLDGGIWESKVHLLGRPGSAAERKARGFHETPLPPFAPLAPDGQAMTPPMGWSSWNAFAERIDDKTVRAMADAMVSSGLRDAGYRFINIDDGWQGTRSARGEIQANAKFPDMKALAEYVHARGLKLGIYSSPGMRTCAGYEGSYGHVAQDAKTFARWGIDYLKYDLCSGEWFYADRDTVVRAYAEMGEALRATGRPIIYSLCAYGRFEVGSWGRSVGGHLWRTTGDITDKYDAMAKIGFDHNGKPADAEPGGWNDPDMLEIGNGGMTGDEYRTHMTLWAMSAAPLLMGHDLRRTTAEAKQILTNREVIAIDQDATGIQAQAVRKAGAIEVWTRMLADGGAAIAIFNRGTAATSADLRPADVHWGRFSQVRNIWAEGSIPGGIERVTVPAHGVALFRVRGR